MKFIGNKETIVAIEWPEKLKDKLQSIPGNIYNIYLINTAQPIMKGLLKYMKKTDEIAQVLEKGGIVIFPTDTAYGIGCRMDDQKAVEKLFRIRKRPADQAVPVLVSGKQMAKQYFKDLPKEVEDLMDKFWPGALTVVYYCQNDKVPALVMGDNGSLGLRMPNYPELLSVIEALGVPILGPSANFHGEKTPFKKEDLDPNLLQLVDYFWDAKALGSGLTSTVIDCTKNPWQILRQGAVNLDL